MNLTLESIFVERTCPLQRGLLDLEMVFKGLVLQVVFQPGEQKSVAEVEVRAVGWLEDESDVPLLHVLAYNSRGVRARIVPLPEQLVQADRF